MYVMDMGVIHKRRKAQLSVFCVVVVLLFCFFGLLLLTEAVQVIAIFTKVKIAGNPLRSDV